jgi:hypothetical protein
LYQAEKNPERGRYVRFESLLFVDSFGLALNVPVDEAGIKEVGLQITVNEENLFLVD